MNKRDTRKLPAGAIQELRYLAVEMKLEGKTYLEIRQNLKVSTTAIVNWMKLYHEGGWENLLLLRRGRSQGSNRTLTPRQETAIQKAIIDKTPEQLKMPFALWRRPAIREMIKKRYNILLPIRTLEKYLKHWGFTPQKPKRRAYGATASSGSGVVGPYLFGVGKACKTGKIRNFMGRRDGGQ